MDMEVAQERAKRQLLNAMKITGAWFEDDKQEQIIFDHPCGDIFLISPTAVHRRLSSGMWGNTCFHFGLTMIPSHEKIAAALLLLFNDPTNFDRWRREAEVNF